MRRTIALFTSTALLMMLGCGPKSAESATPDDLEVLDQKHHSEHGFEADVTVAKAGDGTVSSKAEVQDPASGDRVEVWTDGRTVRWEGTVGGEPVSGTSPATDLASPGAPPEPVCLHPVAALICVGVGLALLSGCAFGFSCDGGPPPTPTEPPGGAGGDPGGGGDGESEGSDDTGD